MISLNTTTNLVHPWNTETEIFVFMIELSTILLFYNLSIILSEHPAIVKFLEL